MRRDTGGAVEPEDKRYCGSPRDPYLYTPLAIRHSYLGEQSPTNEGTRHTAICEYYHGSIMRAMSCCAVS